MVVVNLTLLVELGLFLLFLWAMQRWVLRPLLIVMDERRDKIQNDIAAAEAAEERAAEVERDVFERRREIHREASHRAVEAHREAQEKHQHKIDELRREEERAVAEVRKAAEEELTAQRDQFPALAQDIAKTIADRVGQ